MLIFGFFTSLLGTKVHYFERIQYYFVLSLIFVVPYIYSKLSIDYKKLAMPFCLIMGLLFYVYSLNKNGANPLPYKTIFQQYKYSYNMEVRHEKNKIQYYSTNI